jgi:hypothetical protein
MGGIKFISTSFFEERGHREWTHIFRFIFYEIIWSVYLVLMFGSMYITNKLFML